METLFDFLTMTKGHAYIADGDIGGGQRIVEFDHTGVLCGRVAAVLIAYGNRA